MKPILNKPELVSQLTQYLHDIENLCAEYDTGNESVIPAIAEKMVAVFHNSESAKALLGQLKLGHVAMYCSSEIYNAKSLTNFIGLLKLIHKAEKGWGYVAKLDRSALTAVSTENWWNNKKIIIDSDGNAFTRAKIVKSMANADPVVLNTSGWTIKDTQGNKTIVNPIPETIRQIAFELLESFRDIDLNKESKLHYKL